VKIQTLNGVEVEERISPNSTMRPTKESVSVLVLHADDDTDEAESLSWVSSPASKVSYHFIVGRRGKAYLITHLDRVAWAVGESEFPQATIVGKKSGKARYQHAQHLHLVREPQRRHRAVHGRAVQHRRQARSVHHAPLPDDLHCSYHDARHRGAAGGA
jgi:hypothetical protein